MISEEEAYSLICNGMPESNKFKNFEKLSINSLALTLIKSMDFKSLPDNYFDNYLINNIIFKDSILWDYLNSSEKFSGMKVNDLQVITFTNTELSNNNIISIGVHLNY